MNRPAHGTHKAHLNDRGFATRIEDPKPEAGDAKKGGLSAEEIAQVKAEWEEQQRKKKEKAKEKAKEKEANDGDKAKDGAEASEAKDAKPKSPPATPSATTPVATMPGLAPSGTTAPLAHERFALHRDIFALRQAEHRKRRQTAEAKKLVPRLPAAPSGGFAS